MEHKRILSTVRLVGALNRVKRHGIGNVWQRRLALLQYTVIFMSLFVLSSRIHNHRMSNTPNKMILQLIYEDKKFHSACWAIALLCYHIILRRPSDKHTFKSLIFQYIFTSVIQFVGSVTTYFFEKSCRDCQAAQEKILNKIIAKGVKTQYGCDCNFKELQTVADYRMKHPITTYEHYKNYFQACIHGGHNIVFPGKTDYIGTTSGTTSSSHKEFPRNKKVLLKYYMTSFITCMYSNFREELKELQMWPQVFLRPQISYNCQGTAKGSFSALFQRMAHSTSPACVYDIPDDESALYVHAVFALREPSSRAIFLQISPIALAFFKLIEKKWEMLCDDIENGIIDKEIGMPDKIRSQLVESMTSDIYRANELRSIFKNGFKDLVPRVWPLCSKVTTLSSASFAIQSKIVQKEYCGGIPIISNIHMATEAVYGILGNYQKVYEDYEYILTIDSNFFEFIPLCEIDKEQPETFLANEVKIGERYELVATTREGLYRYRSQDIIQITGFYGSTPKYVLLHRTGDVLNIRTEKLREEAISKAIKCVSSSWTIGQVFDYTSTENINVEKVQNNVSGLLRYIIFMEVVGDKKISEEHNNKLDEVLMEMVDNYRASRLRRGIQPICIIQVKSGTFDKLRKYRLQKNPQLSFGQYKTCRISRKADHIKLLLQNAVK